MVELRSALKWMWVVCAATVPALAVDVSITHVEITQGVQDASNSIGSSASLPFVAGRSTAVRVTVDTGGTNLVGVTGNLKIFDGTTELTPPGVRVTVTGPGPGATATGAARHQPETEEPDGAPPVIVDRDSAYVRASAAALEAGFGATPVFIRCGGSIPVVLTFKRVLGLDTVLMGYGLPDDRAHGPDEKFHLPDFHRGAAASAVFFDEVAKLGG